MNVSLATCALFAVIGAEPDAVGAAPEKPAYPNGQAPWLKLYERTAAQYEIYRDPESEQRLELKHQSVYKWTHAAQTGGQHGAVYVWTYHGCVEAVGCFFMSRQSDGSRSLSHELHSLSPVKLSAVRGGPSRWSPKAGTQRRLLDDAPEPAAAPAARLAQMRAIARDFSGTSTTPEGDRRQLRLLPQPFYRDDSADADVIDGALFAYVCAVGTDPELFMLVEALRTDAGPRWHYALARFSHCKLIASYKEKQVWQAVRGGDDTFSHNADHTYHLQFERVVTDPDATKTEGEEDEKP
ncbi:MAG TPA: hypothetical protein VMV69_06785 [Pirellulales bacterium]|nr:hypothetical protein [Pirellulales bacterium]